MSSDNVMGQYDRPLHDKVAIVPKSSLRAAIPTLLKSPEMTRRLSRNAHHTIASEYTWDHVRPTNCERLSHAAGTVSSFALHREKHNCLIFCKLHDRLNFLHLVITSFVGSTLLHNPA